jgi:HPt (histidine-containing phosphotransfer) domain-containing protein
LYVFIIIIDILSVFFIFQTPPESPYHIIMRAAHVIKGAASNLMCNQLRTASMNLEQTANAAHESGNSITPLQQQTVQQCYVELQQAGQQFYTFLQSIGV